MILNVRQVSDPKKIDVKHLLIFLYIGGDRGHRVLLHQLKGKLLVGEKGN